MSRVIDDKFGHARMYARMLASFPAGALDEEGETLKRKIAAEVIPVRRQKKVERYFNEKLTFLSDNCGALALPTARALKHLHVYRNETQHHDRIRVGSIRPAVLVLFDIAADLLVSLQPSVTTWASDEDYGLGCEGTASRIRFPSDATTYRTRIAAELRSGLPLGVVGIRTALVEHLTDRLDADGRAIGLCGFQLDRSDRIGPVHSRQSSSGIFTSQAAVWRALGYRRSSRPTTSIRLRSGEAPWTS